MKKGVYGILLCLVFLESACNSNLGIEKLAINSSEIIESEQIIDLTKSSFQNKSDIGSIQSENYSINTENFKDTDESKKINVSIKYPRITGLEDTILQSDINNLIKQAALEPYYEIINIYSGISEGTDWPVDYSIVYMTDEILSIKFEGYIYAQGSAHGTNWIYSININLTNGQKITIDELFDESFQNKLSPQYFKGVDVDTINSDDSVLNEMFGHFKSSFEESDNNFYFTDDKFIIILPISDYHQFSSRYKNLKDSMKQDSLIWKYILDNNI